MTQNNRTIFGGLLGLCVATLSGCGWFDGGAPSPNPLGARPGADRLAPVGNALPPPDSGRLHESGVAPADETRGVQAGPTIGSTLGGKGGQKTQKEEAEKQAFEQSRKDRERAADTRKTTPPAPAEH